jgi:putative ABC transport system substrate-binding protein
MPDLLQRFSFSGAKRPLACFLVGLLAVVSGMAHAGDPRIAVLRSSDLASYEAVAEQLLRHPGVQVEMYEIKGKRRAAEVVLKELRENPPDVVIALGAKAAFAAHNGLEGATVVYAMVVNPARYGLSGPQIVGVEHRVSVEEQFAHLRLFAPSVHSIGMLLWQGNHSDEVAEVQRVGVEAEYEIKVLRVASDRDVRGAFQRLRKDIDALWLLPDQMVITPENFRYLRDETRRLGIPLMVYSEDLVRAGALMCVAPNLQAVGEQLIAMTQEILGGTAVGDLEDRSPGRARVVLNRDTLDAIGLKLDPLLLDFADEVFSEVTGR